MHIRKYFAIAISLLLTGSAVKSHDKVPLRKDLEGFHRTVTTTSVEAQKYFDQGFTLYYGFNHQAAIASFAQAAALDTNCAMAWWGQALSAGPSINNRSMDSNASIAAWNALRHAIRLAPGSSQLEQDLIRALTARYAWPAPKNRTDLDAAYANAMRPVWQAH